MMRRWWTAACAAVLLLGAGCGQREPEGQAPESESPASTEVSPSAESAAATAEVAVASGPFDIVARGLRFEEAPDSVSSGWNTFRFSNESTMEHFALFERLPTGRSIADQQLEIAPIFQHGMDLLSTGDPDGATAKFGELPPWLGGIVFTGGAGLVSPGRTSEATVYLEPGTYLIECYVKTGGIFHSYNPQQGAYGMVHQFEVTEDRSTTEAPDANVEITISKDGGFEISGEPKAGSNTVAVHYADQAAHENFVGHDVHVAMLPDGAVDQTLVEWMDWRAPTGLETPAPATFVGGLNEMPAETTGYFSVSLGPGSYAWVAEVPQADQKGMLQHFVIGE